MASRKASGSDTVGNMAAVAPTTKRVDHTVSQLVETVREEHSKKPDEVRKRIVEFTGDVPRIELFARQAATGWDCWGNEVGKFEEVNE